MHIILSFFQMFRLETKTFEEKTGCIDLRGSLRHTIAHGNRSFLVV